MVKKAAQRGHSERTPEAYFFWYVAGGNDARTKLEAFFTIRQLIAIILSSAIFAHRLSSSGTTMWLTTWPSARFSIAQHK